jgi:hypothetical protein
MRHVTDTTVDVTLSSTPPSFTALPWIGSAEIDGNRLRCEVATEHIGELLTCGSTTSATRQPTAQPGAPWSSGRCSEGDAKGDDADEAAGSPSNPQRRAFGPGGVRFALHAESECALPGRRYATRSGG